MQFDIIKCHGSGNDFPLIDARSIDLSNAEWARIARALADRSGPVGGDGLLLLVAGRGDAAFGQRMFNPDGSEAETCLNGLRCTARAGFEATGLAATRMSLPRSEAEAARAPDLAPGVYTVATRVTSISGAMRDVGLMLASGPIVEERIPGLPSERAFTALAMPNPHLITFVDAIDEAELVALGDWCEGAPPLIPGRTNVSFVTQAAANRLFVRTYERGVGLTDSCGSAMAASVRAAALTERIAWDREIEVRNRGGLVRAQAGRDAVSIAGNATFEARLRVTLDPVAARVIEAEPIEHHETEIAAWTAAIGALSD